MTDPTHEHIFTDGVCDCGAHTQPTLSQDVLEAVPAWGAEFARMQERHEELIRMLTERVAALEEMHKLSDLGHGPLPPEPEPDCEDCDELCGEPTPREDLD